MTAGFRRTQKCTIQIDGLTFLLIYRAIRFKVDAFLRHSVELSVIAERLKNLVPFSYPHLPSLAFIRHCFVNRRSSLAKRRWPLRSRDVTGHVDGSVWSGVNASSWHVYNTTGGRLSNMLLGYVACSTLKARIITFYHYLPPTRTFAELFFHFHTTLLFTNGSRVRNTIYTNTL